jgi:hypothetical protein
MPLHDILEGRYPATATLQNANSDDAAAQWLANATHMRYATRWLQTALREVAPVADRVIAVQLDDDQGAYIDNQTWPAPHLQAYLRQLESIVRAVVGPRLPVFINTYEMKVTASAPVWAMGNWYQSDAYAIGEHDRAALEFSTGLLQTQARFPVAMSEFQAGWLAPPEDPAPRPADPTNTTLALHTLLSLGLRGAIDFPAQDTVSPDGWEAPFANADYVWDAALGIDLTPSVRYAPTKRFGDLVRSDGQRLATARRWADGAIAYLTSAYDETQLTNADVFAVVARTQDAQQACRARHLTCDLVDLRFGGDAVLRRYPFLVVPHPIARSFTAAVRARLAEYRSSGGRVLDRPPGVVSPRAGGIADAAVLLAADGTAYLDVVNFDAAAHPIPTTRIVLPGAHVWTIAPFTVPARDAVLLRSNGAKTAAAGPRGEAAKSEPTLRCASPPSNDETTSDEATSARWPARTIVHAEAGGGYPRITLTNGVVAVTVAPHAGARSFAFASVPDGCGGYKNAFTSVGALRDDVAIQPPLSTTDRIGTYTRSFPAGMFNRDYAYTTRESPDGTAELSLRYSAPDVVPAGAAFERRIALEPRASAFTVTAHVTFGAGEGVAGQRAVRYDSFDTRGATVLDERADGAVGIFDPVMKQVAIVAWPPGEVEAAQLMAEQTSTVLRLQFAPGETTTRYAIDPAADADTARAMLLKERLVVVAKR